ncbi:unnamed protein product [Linum trigynum]|uniref:Uncharacterized protein n=1 Tax=Linum trigynum TaxID=586398 RepID=A0AAV2G0Q7_9ROSI
MAGRGHLSAVPTIKLFPISNPLAETLPCSQSATHLFPVREDGPSEINGLFLDPNKLSTASIGRFAPSSRRDVVPGSGFRNRAYILCDLCISLLHALLKRDGSGFVGLER